jgi:hypothetical protein
MTDDFKVEPTDAQEKSLSHVSIERTASGKVVRKLTAYADDSPEVLTALRGRAIEQFVALEADIERYEKEEG